MTSGYYKGQRGWRVGLLILVGFYGVCLGHPFAGGDGSLADPYRIATAAQLRAIGSSVDFLDKHFVLISDIDLQSQTAQCGPYVTGQAFEGWLDGRGHLIKGLRILGPPGQGCLGLFGRIGGSAVILDLHIDGSIESAAGKEVGLLAGISEGHIIGCSASGRVSGNTFVGLLVGSQSGGSILYCHANGLVKGGSGVGRSDRSQRGHRGLCMLCSRQGLWAIQRRHLLYRLLQPDRLGKLLVLPG
ncbi:MAG: hypothetical protein QHH07_08810 [Sedimentisphaerales bacterium]|nr:hypothetical protein [Sedimentisphaerales bacterium]